MIFFCVFDSGHICQNVFGRSGLVVESPLRFVTTVFAYLLICTYCPVTLACQNKSPHLKVDKLLCTNYLTNRKSINEEYPK